MLIFCNLIFWYEMTLFLSHFNSLSAFNSLVGDFIFLMDYNVFVSLLFGLVCRPYFHLYPFHCSVSNFVFYVLNVGIFQPHIVYLLCLATAVDIVLLGVSFRHTGSDCKMIDFIALFNY